MVFICITFATISNINFEIISYISVDVIAIACGSEHAVVVGGQVNCKIINFHLFLYSFSEALENREKGKYLCWNCNTSFLFSGIIVHKTK